MSHDYSDYQEQPTSADGLKQLSTYADLALQQQADITELEEKLKAAKERYKRTIENDIPEIMNELGVKAFDAAGLKITLKREVFASIKPENEEAAFQWLEDNDLGSIIKDQFTVAFGRGENLSAEQLAERLSDMEHPYKRKRSVHPGTLRSTIRELIGDAEEESEVPYDTFGVFVKNTAKIKIG